MAQQEELNFNVNTNAGEVTKTFTSLKTQVREATLAFQSASEQFGEYSNQAIQAAKKVADLKDRVGDAQAQVNAFKPGGGFKALAEGGSLVAASFGAIQGAMALAGTESKDLEKSLLKVQGAMALAQGLGALADVPDTFKNIQAAAKNAFLTIKEGIGSTGIGLLVVALGALVVYWDDISKAIGGATESQKAYTAAQEDVTKSLVKVEENLINVTTALAQARKGTIDKKDALKLYNEKLGESLGKTDDLATAEQRIKDNTASYIKAQMARAQAQIFVAKAAEAAANAATGKSADLSFWDEAKAYFLGFGNSAVIAKNLATASANNIVKNQKDISFYTKLANDALATAGEEEIKINANKINKIYDDAHKVDKKKIEDKKKTSVIDTELYRNQQAALKKANDDELALLDIIEKSKKEINDRTLSDKAKEIQAENDAFKILYDTAVRFYQDTEVLEANHRFKLNDIQMKYRDKINAENKKQQEKEILEFIVKFDEAIKNAEKIFNGVSSINGLLNQLDSNRLNDIQNLHNAELESLDNKQKQELSNINLTESQKVAINNKYAKMKYESDLKAFNETDKIKRKEFARDKALKMVGVVIDTAKSISGSIASSPLTFGMPWAAVNAAIGAVQLATIASQKYQGETGPSAPSIGGASGGGSSSSTDAAATPSTTLVGNRNQGNNTGAAGTVNAVTGQILDVRAYVSETDITDVQGRVAKMKNSAEL
jgi:hypothetical protein